MSTQAKARRLVSAAASVAILGAVAACGGASSDEADDTIKVGVPLGLTGATAAVGDWARMGVELSVEQINADGGIDGREVEVIFADTEADPTKAVTAMNRLINQEKVDLIVGPMTSDETLATLPATTKANIPSINGSGSEITPEVAPYSFAMLMNAEHQAQKMVEFAFDRYDASSVATLNYSATQGKTAAAAFDEALEERGTEATASQEFDVPVTDLAPQLLSLQKGDPDVLLSFNQTGDDTGRLVLGVRELGWDVPVIGSYATTFAQQAMGLAGPDTFENLKSVTWSAFSACSADEVREESTEFIANVQESFDEKRTANASYDYVAVYRDALFLLKAAVEATGTTDGDKVAAWLEDEGPETAPSLPLVHEGYAMSEDNHFLMDTSSLALVDAGQQIAPNIMQRLDCE